MHRAEARARLVRRVAPLVVGAAVLGSGAYLVAKTVKGESRDLAGPKPIPSVPDLRDCDGDSARERGRGATSCIVAVGGRVERCRSQRCRRT